MKRIFTLTVFMCFGIQTIIAQFDVIGSEDYGRLFDVTYDPVIQNKLYAVTLGNHIVTSNDNGQSWEILYSYPVQSTALDGLQFLNGNQLSFFVKFSSSNSLIILDLTTLQILNEFVLPVPPGSDLDWIESYDIYENNTDIAIIHQGFRIGFSNYAKVYYTTDGGNTFQEIYYNDNFDSVFPNNVAIHPTNPDILFIARGNGPTNIDGGIFKSIDAGANWVEKLPGNTFDAIAFHPQNPDIILLGTGIGYGPHVQNLYRSTDAGENWSIIPVSWTDETLDNITAIKFNQNNPDNIIVLEENEIVITNDGFTTWQNYVYPTTNIHSYYYGLNASFNPFQVNEIYISSNYHVLFSDDGGHTVNWAKNPYFTTTGNINFFSNSQESHLYYGVQFGYLHRNMQTLQENPYEIKPLDYVSNSPGITVYTDNHIPGRVYTFEDGFLGSNLYVSNDHGQNREQIHSLMSNSFHAVSSKPANPNLIWASFSNFGGDPELLEIDFSDLNNIQITPITLPLNDMVTDLYFNPQSPNEIILTIGTSVFISTDGGTTWTDTSNGLNALVPLQDLIFNLSVNPFDANHMSIATSKGIFNTQDGGMLWEQKTLDVIHNISHSNVTNGHIIAATHSSDISSFGIIFSEDGGENWVIVPPVDIHFVSSGTTAFHFFTDNADVYIGTYDLGLVKYNLILNSLNNSDFNNNYNTLKIYPNPVTDILKLDAGDNTIEQFSIYSITGQKLMNIHGSNNANISALENGLYLVNVTLTDGKSTTKKIVKN